MGSIFERSKPMYNEEIEQQIIVETERFKESFFHGEFKKVRSDNHGPNYRLKLLKEDEDNFLEFLNSDLAVKIFNQEDN